MTTSNQATSSGNGVALLEKVPGVKLATISKDDVATQVERKQMESIKEQSTLVHVLFDKIKIREGHNTRKDFGDLEELANQIEATGGLIVPLQADVLKTGEVVLTFGERRFRAIQMLRKRSPALKAKFEYVPVLVNERDLTDLSRLIIDLVSNSGKSLAPVESAEVFRRIRDEHKNPDGSVFSIADIARMTGRSVPFVEQQLIIADQDGGVKEAIKEGKISATAVVQTSRKTKGSKAEKKAAVKKIVKKAVKAGKKVKVKDVKKPAGGTKASKILGLADQGLVFTKELKATSIGKKVIDLVEKVEKSLRAIKRAV